VSLVNRVEVKDPALFDMIYQAVKCSDRALANHILSHVVVSRIK
jgi:hypothetical protein